MRKLLIAVVCCFVFAGCASYSKEEKPPMSNGQKSTSTPKSTETPAPTKTPTPIPTITPEPTPTPTAEQKKQIENAYKTTCRKYADDTYERLMRENTQNGTRLCLEVKVVQDMNGSYVNYYRVNGTKDSLNEEYIIYDYRENDATKILVGDILTIYGEFNKLGEFKRSLTGTTVEIPIINAQYIDFTNTNSENTSVAEATATPVPYIVSFNQSGEVFSEYNYKRELEGSARIDGISYEFDKYGDLIITLKGQVIECSDDFYIAYRLYDEEDYVIDDGIIGIDGLKSGDKFKNKRKTILNIEKGNYRIELADRK